MLPLTVIAAFNFHAPCAVKGLTDVASVGVVAVVAQAVRVSDKPLAIMASQSGIGYLLTKMSAHEVTTRMRLPLKITSV